MSLIDFIFPKRCVGCKTFGSYLCAKCFSTISFSTTYICFVCNRASINGLTHPGCKKPWTIEGIYSSLVYTGIVKRLIYQFKYQPNLIDLKETLTDLFYEGIIQHEGLKDVFDNKSVLVPIPLHPSKQRKRGYNQAEILAKGLAERGLAPSDIGSLDTVYSERSRTAQGKLRAKGEVRDILRRTKRTESQFSLDREKRRQNIQDAFSLKKGTEVKGKTILLVDDVVTSGATLIEAAKVLKRSGAEKVYGITLAHGQ